MIVNVYCPSKDKYFSLNVGDELSLRDFKALCSTECGILPSAMKLYLNNRPLNDDGKILKSYNVADNDMFMLQTAVMPFGTPSIPSMPQIDFSNVRVPGQSSTTRQSQPATRQVRQPGSHNMDDPAVLRDRLLNSPHDLAILKERNPPLAEALLSGDLKRFTTEYQKIRDAAAKAEQEKIRMLNADPMDLEVQRKIAEEIERKNIEENMHMAIEEAPESFGQVVMLWINVKVNGHQLKAFVDTGAQMTIMSSDCAKRCNIMRLVDKRWEGVAKGVGTQKIIGRIHLAQIQIEDVFLQCSFSVLEEQSMDMLLGLDMLRRHLCVIDLKENSLTIGTTQTKTKFLSESELPSHGRLHVPAVESRSEEEEVNRALLESAAEAIKRGEANNASVEPAAKVAKSPSGANASSASTSGQSDSSPNQNDKVQQLISMGFPRSAAEEELKKVNGDLQRAIVSLLMKNVNKNKS